MTELKTRLRNDMVAAMRAGEKEKRDALRMLMAAVKQVEVDERVSLDDEGVLKLLGKQAKQRRESIADYEKAGRLEMAAEEQAELDIIEAYLPQMMSREEVTAVASTLISELNVSGPKAMGQVMGRLMGQLKGKADGRTVNQVVRELLLQNDK